LGVVLAVGAGAGQFSIWLTFMPNSFGYLFIGLVR
jgi:hypothetical protein